MKIKRIIILSLLLLGLSLGCEQNGFSYVSIKDLSQDAPAYVGQNISISGKLNDRLGGYSLEDSEGFWVWIEENCIETQRRYNFNSEIYSGKGVWLSGKEAIYGFSFGLEYKYRLSCVSPLS
ncbi:MAG: hypothetical protein ABIH63_04405 [archaeon]